jgi:hypothetical protein
MSKTKKYLELDSTFRNRNQYPNPSDFVVPYQISGSYNNCVDAFDPVCLSSPFEKASGATLVSGNTVTLVPFISSSTDNFYVNQYIGLMNTSVSPYTIQYSKISEYRGMTRTITTLGNFSIPLGVYSYVIRKQLPADIPYNTNNELSSILFMTAVVGFTPTMVTLQPTSSSVADAYNGMIIRLFSPTSPIEEYQVVSNYDPTTHVISTTKPFSNVFAPVTTYYELLPFSRDNLKPLKYQGTSNMNQAVCYSVRLVNISIPFIIRSYTDTNGVEMDERALINVANGGTIDQYPFFYVCLYSDIHNDNMQSIISNNPNSSYALFRVPVSSGDTPGPKKIMSQTCFSRCDMCPVIKFLPNDTFHMSVMLPNGELLSFKQKDNASPLEPNYKLQISAFFELTRLE